MSDGEDEFDPDKFFATYRDVLSSHDPFIQAVLNAHLDVEAHLGEFLEQLVFHPVDLNNAGLRYLSKVYLARSFVQLGRSRPDWRIMIELNAIRNKIAHRNYRQALTVELKKLREIMRDLGAEEFKNTIRTCGSTELIVNAALVCTGYLTHLTDQVKQMHGKEISDE